MLVFVGGVVTRWSGFAQSAALDGNGGENFVSFSADGSGTQRFPSTSNVGMPGEPSALSRKQYVSYRLCEPGKKMTMLPSGLPKFPCPTSLPQRFPWASKAQP